MIPKAEEAHWLAAAVALLIGLLLVSELIVGREVFRARAWRAYLFPGVVVGSSVMLWLITIFSTFSTMHLLAHAIWAQAALVAGAVELASVRGKLRSPRWSLVPGFALFVSGVAFLVHEQYAWLYSRRRSCTTRSAGCSWSSRSSRSGRRSSRDGSCGARGSR